MTNENTLRERVSRANIETQRVIVEAIDTNVLLEAAQRRRETIREELGPYGIRKVMRPCKGCNQVFSAREMRTHKCVVNWTKR
jgi:hypothetical protein